MTTGAKWCSTGTNGAGGAAAHTIAGLTVRPSPAATCAGPQRVRRAVLLDREHRELHDRTDVVQPELELGHDAEVAAAAAQRPEQVRVLGRTRPDTAPVGQHDLGRLEVVDREPVHPAEPSPAAAECQPADTRVADCAGRDRQTVLLGGGVELPERGAPADADPAGRRIDHDVVDQAQIDHHTALGHRGTPVAVPAAADGHLEPGVLGVPQCDRNIVRPGAPRDDGGPPVDVAVPHRPRLVVPLVARQQHRAVHRRTQRGDVPVDRPRHLSPSFGQTNARGRPRSFRGCFPVHRRWCHTPPRHESCPYVRRRPLNRKRRSVH